MAIKMRAIFSECYTSIPATKNRSQMVILSKPIPDGTDIPLRYYSLIGLLNSGLCNVLKAQPLVEYTDLPQSQPRDKHCSIGFQY